MLAFRNVSKSFWTGTQHKVILDRASFRVELGKSMGILAPNGTGKTTLINMMAGLEKPDEGEVYRGCNISFPLGFMGAAVGKVSAMENSRYIARLYGLTSDYTGLIPIMSRAFVVGCVALVNTLTNLSVHIRRGCAHAFPSL
tara:strand:+ start:839 stop:1264 length:426 start_codon:yes stop_codon:yes gene_type:complete